MEETPIRGFYVENVTQTKWPENIAIGLYYPDGGCKSEFEVEWHKLGDKIYPRLQIFDDGWSILWHEFKDLLAALAVYDSKNITVKEFTQILINLGIKDLTKYPKTDLEN